ncbi:MAG: DNA alkylation repair protein [Myxococcota bacterium]
MTAAPMEARNSPDDPGLRRSPRETGGPREDPPARRATHSAKQTGGPREDPPSRRATRSAKTTGGRLDGAALLRALRAAYAAEGDPRRARDMQAYMKSAMPFHGVPMARTRALARELVKDARPADAQQLWAAVRALWHGAKFREERYAALELLSRPWARKLESPDALPLYEELISTGAWWDLVDELAAHRVGSLLAQWPDEVKSVLRRWSRGGDLWLRRAAIIAQLRHREATDVDLLFEVIEPAVGEKEFFLKKAIGWALRELARWKPRDVERWLSEHEGRAAGLTVREARRGLERGRR